MRSRRLTGRSSFASPSRSPANAIEIDFDGTADQHRGNLNCPLAVTRSACFYVVRCLTAPDLPASGGAFTPVTVRAPAGCLVNARPPAAVAAGNTETSSRIVDVVFAALAHAIPVPAQGQGTMNNVVFGNERFTYYETIGGGQGACPDARGPSAVHVAMSNTLNTPVEALELSYPLRVERYELRRRLRRCREVPRRRRRHPRAACARSLPSLAPDPAPRARAARRCRRRGRPSRPESPERARSCRHSRLSSSRPATCCGSRRRAAAATVRKASDRARSGRRDRAPELEVAAPARPIDDEVLRLVAPRNGQVAGSQELASLARPLERPVDHRVGDVAGRRDRDVDGREGGDPEARLLVGVHDRPLGHFFSHRLARALPTEGREEASAAGPTWRSPTATTGSRNNAAASPAASSTGGRPRRTKP